jgi:hypothetical protein
VKTALAICEGDTGINHPLKEGFKAALPSEHRRKALTPDEAPIMIRKANAAWMRAFA